MNLLFSSFVILTLMSCSVVATKPPTPQVEEPSEIDHFVAQSLQDTSNSLHLIETVSSALDPAPSGEASSQVSVLTILTRVFQDTGLGKTELNETDGTYDYYVNGKIERGVVAEIKFSGLYDDNGIELQNIGIRVGEGRYYQFFKNATYANATSMELDFNEVAAFSKALEEHIDNVAHPTVLGSLFVYLKEGRTYLNSSNLKVLQEQYTLDISSLVLVTKPNSTEFEEAYINGAAYDSLEPDEHRADLRIKLNQEQSSPEITFDHTDLPFLGSDDDQD